MSAIMDWADAGMVLVVRAAAAAIPLALLVLAIDATAGRRMPARHRCLLWTLVAVRLLMPVAPASFVSLQNVWRMFAFESQEAPRDAIAVASAPYAAPMAAAAAPAQLQDDARMGAMSFRAKPQAAGLDWFDVVLAGSPIVWFAGAAFVYLRAAISSARFARRLKRIPCVQEPAIVALLARVCEQVGVKQHVALKHVQELSAPALFGVFRPTLCLPVEARTQLSDDELRLIMIHEAMHVRRRDGMLSWLLAVVQAAQWFNPIAWLATSRIALYREQACDDAVRHLAAPQQRRVYTDLLVRFASARPTASLGLVGLWFARPVRRLAARIHAFGAAEERRRTIPRIAVVAIVALAAIGGLSDAADIEPNPRPQSIQEFMATGPHGPREVQVLAPTANDPEMDVVEERTYDVSKALAKISELDPDADAKKRLLTYLKLPSWTAQTVREDEDDADQLHVTMSRRGHASFTDFLDNLSRSGPWQVVVRTRVLSAPQIEALGELDWEDVVKFAASNAAKAPQWPARGDHDGKEPGQALALSSESVTWDYAPYMAVVIDEGKLDRIMERFQGDLRYNARNNPTITVFGGQRSSFCDFAQVPFVVGVDYVKGEFATAAQATIEYLDVGTCLDVQPRVVDAGALDLECRLTLTKLDRVEETKVPGQEITVQNPHVSRRTISAACRVAPGETLLVAPLTPRGEGDAREFDFYLITPQWFPDTLEGYKAASKK